jgi:hypothetical protein
MEYGYFQNLRFRHGFPDVYDMSLGALVPLPVPRCSPVALRPRVRAPREACAALLVAMFDCYLCPARGAIHLGFHSTPGSTTLPRTTGSIRVVGTMGHSPRKEVLRVEWKDCGVAAGRLESSPAVVLVPTDLEIEGGTSLRSQPVSSFHPVFLPFSFSLSLPALSRTPKHRHRTTHVISGYHFNSTLQPITTRRQRRVGNHHHPAYYSSRHLELTLPKP